MQGEEVDLLVEIGPHQFVAIECKTASDVDSHALKGFFALESVYGAESVKKGAVVCRTGHPYPLAPKSRWAALPIAGKNGLAHWLRQVKAI